MRPVQKILATAITAALAGSMVCIVPVAAMAQPAPTATSASNTYSAMAKAKFKTQYATLLPGQTKTLKVKGAKVKS